LIERVKNDPVFKQIVKKGIDLANKEAISKAQYIRKWDVIEEFQVGVELTPTMKLKRKEVMKKHSQLIEKMYLDPAL